MEEGETAGAAPHRLCPLHRGDADQTGERSGLKQVADVLTGPLQASGISTCLVGVGGEGGRQDLPSLSFLVVSIIDAVVVFIRGGGAEVALDQSLSSSLVGFPDLLKLGLDSQTMRRFRRRARLRSDSSSRCSAWPLSLLLQGS